MKAICYLFLFIKQRTVRTMQPKLHWLEKIALQNTLSIAALLPCAAWLIQGDQSPLDSTCVMAVEPWLTLILLGADVALSLIYLYLFIQPLVSSTHRAALSSVNNTQRASQLSSSLCPAF